MEQELSGQSKNNTRDTIIIIVSIFLFFNKIFWLSVKNTDYSYWKLIGIFDLLSGLFWAATPLLLAFVVRNRIWKIILIAFGGLYALISLITIIRNISQGLYF